jgi:hypothetical protein
MLGGNTRTGIYRGKLPHHIQDRLDIFKPNHLVYENKCTRRRRRERKMRHSHTYITLNFGSLHGSVFTLDRGSCAVPKGVVEEICSWGF